MRVLVSLTLLAVLAGAFLWERHAITTLRARNEALRAQGDEARQLAEDTRDLESLRASAASAGQRRDNTELLRLRNDIRQLRAQQQEVEKLRAANQRVAAEIQAGKFSPRRLSDQPGAVPREKWAFAGFATPEAAVQSFFAALSTGDPEQFLRCAGPQGAERMRREMLKDPERFRKDFAEELGKMGKVSAFRITDTRVRNDDPDRLEILVQVVAEGEAMPLPLRRIGNEWKFED